MSIAALLAAVTMASSSPSPSLHFDLGSGDDVVRFEPLVVLQVDARAVLHDDDNAVEGESGFVIPRGRLGGRLRWRFFDVQVIGEGAREKAGLLEAFGVVHLGDFAVDVGLARSPLMIGGPDPLTLQPLNERSVLERTMWPGRELGVGVRWSPTKLPLEAWARVSNGVANAVLGNDNEGLAAEARIDGVFGSAAMPRRRALDDDRDDDDDDDDDDDKDDDDDDRDFLGLRVGVGARVERTDNEAGMPGITSLNSTYWRAPPVSGPSATVQAHAQGFLGPARLTLQGGFAHESRARDDDGNPSTPKVPIVGVQHAGVSAEVAAVIVGERRVFGTMARAASLASPVIEVAARGERVLLGLTPQGEDPDPSIVSGGAAAVSAAVTWWMHPSLSLSAQVYALNYDVAPVDDTDRTTSLTGLLRLTIVNL